MKSSFVQNSDAIFNTPRKKNYEVQIRDNNYEVPLSVRGAAIQPKHLSPLNWDQTGQSHLFHSKSEQNSEYNFKKDRI